MSLETRDFEDIIVQALCRAHSLIIRHELVQVAYNVWTA